MATVKTNIEEQNRAGTKWTILMGGTAKSAVQEHGCCEVVAILAGNWMIAEWSMGPLGALDGMMIAVPLGLHGCRFNFLNDEISVGTDFNLRGMMMLVLLGLH